MENTFLDFPIFELPTDTTASEDVQGEGKKQVLLIAERTRSAREDLEFAGKIVQAVGLSLPSDVFVLLKTPEQAVRLSSLATELPAARILVFGPGPDSLGLHVRHLKYRPVRLGRFALIFADSLATLREERATGKKALALQLWQALQELFPENQRT